MSCRRRIWGRAAGFSSAARVNAGRFRRRTRRRQAKPLRRAAPDRAIAIGLTCLLDRAAWWHIAKTVCTYSRPTTIDGRFVAIFDPVAGRGRRANKRARQAVASLAIGVVGAARPIRAARRVGAAAIDIGFALVLLAVGSRRCSANAACTQAFAVIALLASLAGTARICRRDGTAAIDARFTSISDSIVVSERRRDFAQAIAAAKVFAAIRRLRAFLPIGAKRGGAYTTNLCATWRANIAGAQLALTFGGLRACGAITPLSTAAAAVFADFIAVALSVRTRCFGAALRCAVRRPAHRI